MMKYASVPRWLTDKLSHNSIAVVSTPDSHVHQAHILPSSNVISHADQPMVWPQPITLGLNPPESVCQPDLEIDYGNPARSYPQVDSLPVFSPQSSNCSSNGDMFQSKVTMNILTPKLRLGFWMGT